MESDWIKHYIYENPTISLNMLDMESGEQIFTTFKFIYVNAVTGDQIMKQCTTSDVDYLLDSVVIGNVMYKLHKSEKNYLEFIRELDLKKLHWMPSEFDYVFKERIKIYEDDYMNLHISIEYQSPIDIFYWKGRFYGGPC